MSYNKLASAIQSRIARRAATITEQENWKIYHRVLEQMTDWRDSKALIAELTESQILDKKLLKVIQELAHAEQEYDKLVGA